MLAQVVGNRDERAVEAYLYDDEEEEEQEATLFQATPPELVSTESKTLSASWHICRLFTKRTSSLNDLLCKFIFLIENVIKDQNILEF